MGIIMCYSLYGYSYFISKHPYFANVIIFCVCRAFRRRKQ